jgi:Sulfotransferase domain
MKLIGAGLPRTATTTQKMALEMLGLPCYHMRDLLMNMGEHVPLWDEACEGRGDWDRIFDGYDSTVDWPAARFWRELIDVYPDSKVLLSVRDHESWERSMRDTVWDIYFGDSVMHHLSRARYHVDPEWRAWIDLMTRMTWAGKGAFAGAYAERQQMMDAAEAWNEEVRQTVPQERLLVWQPQDGWEPLCEFLEVDVPDDPVPHVNDTDAFKEGITGGALGAIQAWFEGQKTPA